MDKKKRKAIPGNEKKAKKETGDLRLETGEGNEELRVKSEE
jgi:hypothetical protein